MNVQIKYFGIPQNVDLDERIERKLKTLEAELQVDQANIRLSCYPDVSPSFQVYFHFVTPGPDLFATGLDHTLSAALEKAFREMRIKIAARRSKQAVRSRSSIMVAQRNGRARVQGHGGLSH